MSNPLPIEDLELVSSLSAPFWEMYRGTSMLVTGGTGFIGRWLLEAVQHANDTRESSIRLVVLTRDIHSARRRLPHVFARPDIVPLEGDIRTFVCAKGDVDICLHGAAAYDGSPDSVTEPSEVFDTMVNGTRRTLEIADNNKMSRYLLISSGAVYGNQPKELAYVSESYEGAPSTLSMRAAYGNGKRTSEWLVAAAAARRTTSGTTIARIFSVIGPGMPLDRHFAAGNFIRDAIAGRPIGVRDGRPVRSYIYAADLCVWLLRILGSGTNGHAYNVGCERALSISDLARLVGTLGNAPVSIDEAETLAPTSGADRYVPDTTKARTELGLEEYTSTELAVRKSLEWSRSCPVR